eukprot:2482198-Pyramimonas_sp.AAC.1
MAASMIVSCPTVAQARTCVPSSKAVQPRAGGSLVTQRSISPSRWHPGLDDPVLQYIRSERRTRMELPRACMRTLPMFEASTGLRVAKRLVARRRSVCVRSTNKVRKSLGGGFVEVACCERFSFWALDASCLMLPQKVYATGSMEEQAKQMKQAEDRWQQNVRSGRVRSVSSRECMEMIT